MPATSLVSSLGDTLPIRLSSRAKRMSIAVHWDGRWEIILPARRPPSAQSVRRFVQDHWNWIEEQIQTSRNNKSKIPLVHRGIPRKKIEEKTKLLIEQHVNLLCHHYPFRVTRVKLGNYSAQWGSCSQSSTLSFHYKLSLLPSHLCQYVVAHELAHTIHFDHSKAFWTLLDSLCPGAKQMRAELRQYLL